MNFPLQQRPVVRSAAMELMLLAGVLATAFTYLEVPLWNSLLFGVAVTSQAAFGTVVLTRILQGVPSSLLLLLGPGLILGGALSFALFQIVARGVIGLIVVVIVGFTSVAHLVHSPRWQPLGSERLWVLGQVVGLAALALTWEFPELLPVAIAFFALGFLTGDMFTTPRSVKQVAVVIAAAVIITPLFFRQDYWWIVTDDYQILEIQMRHWTKSGIFAMWGEHDWRKYHWLSHGWGGLLNQLGGQPETFTTLTRVMPFAYSAAFAASILVLKKLLSRNTTSTLLFSVSSWGVVGVSRLDWSATSTGGAIAFVSAAITVGVLTLAERCSFSTRLVTSTLLLTFAAITKFPSVFLLFIFFFALEVFNFFRHCRVKRLTTFILSYTTLGLPALVTLVFISSTLVDGFSIAPVNRELGEIKTLEIPFAFIFVMLSKLWLIIPLLLLLLSQWRSNSELRNSTPSSFILAMTPLFLGGIFFDVAISAVNSNGHEYFSGPFYFLASLSLLLWVEPYWELHTSKALRLCTLMVSSFFVLTSFLTQHLQVPTKLTEYFSSKLSGVKNRSSLLIFVLSDIRLAASISALTLVLLGTFIHRRNILGVVSSLLVALVVLTFCSYLPVTLKTFSQARDETEIGSLYGNQDLQKIGAWLKTATNESDFIATNYLQNRRGELISDYSLAVWSERTFFVLGPKFFSDNSSQIVATAISKRFAETASKQNANKLWDAGVRWFVIDTALVIRDNWLESADEKYRTGRFVILRLRDPT